MKRSKKTTHIYFLEKCKSEQNEVFFIGQFASVNKENSAFPSIKNDSDVPLVH